MTDKIELTNLKNPASKVIKRLTDEAIKEKYWGVCVLNSNTLIVDARRKYLKSDIKIITVAGFPPVRLYNLVNNNPMYQFSLGFYNRKAFSEIRKICNNPVVDELDVVFPMAMYYGGKKKRVVWLLRGIKQKFKKTVKVIIELGTIFKQEENIKEICFLLEEAGVDFVKTNTGLITQKYEDLADHIQTLQQCTNLPIKASGGIRTIKQAETLSLLGVARIGTSALSEEEVS